MGTSADSTRPSNPLSSLIVRLPYRVFIPTIIMCWAVSLLGMAGSTSYAGLMACRFLLGWFEAAAIPVRIYMLNL